MEINLYEIINGSEIDSSNSCVLIEAIRRKLSEGKKDDIVLDMKNIKSIDATGIANLLSIRGLARNISVSNVESEIKDRFENLGISEIFPTIDIEEVT